MGRKHSGKDGHREQAPKKVRGFARGHGAHHRLQGRGAPRRLATGRDRTEQTAPRGKFDRLSDEELENLANDESVGDLDRRIEELEEAAKFGAELQGIRAQGIVLEVRRGNFLTQIVRALPGPNGGELALEHPQWKAGTIIRTFVRGLLQQFDMGLATLVAPGDDIEIVIPPLATAEGLVQSQLYAVLAKIRPRRNEFRRLHPSGRAIQTLATNLDLVLIVASAAEPPFRPGFVDRVLVCAATNNLPAALVLNKIDLGVKSADDELLEVYRSLKTPVLKISVADIDAPQGQFAELKQLLAGKRTLLTGHSGVGKSTLLLALDPNLTDDEVRVGYVSASTSKGTHTTTHGHLYQLRLPEGQFASPACALPELAAAQSGQAEALPAHVAQVIDTPGVREFTPADTDRRNLWGWFPEIVRLQGQCTFSNCTHTVEKGCAVLVAVSKGEIHPRRHQSYVRIYQTLTT